jgi:hypothetical protein
MSIRQNLSRAAVGASAADDGRIDDVLGLASGCVCLCRCGREGYTDGAGHQQAFVVSET